MFSKASIGQVLGRVLGDAITRSGQPKKRRSILMQVAGRGLEWWRKLPLGEPARETLQFGVVERRSAFSDLGLVAEEPYEIDRHIIR